MVGDILQPTHLLFILVVALLVLGPKRLPEVGRTLGNGLRDFRSAINGESSESRNEIDSHPLYSEPDPEDKHEFAHTGETTPGTHQFAHDAPGVSASAPETAQAQGAPATPAPSAPVAPADSAAASASPAPTGDAAATPAKHEFAYESSDPAENPAGPRT